MYDLSQNYVTALLSYHEALLYDSTSSSIYLAIGKDYLALGKFKSAYINLKRCLKYNPHELEAKELIAKIYASEGRLDLTEKIYNNILAQDSSYMEAYYDLAVLYLKMNNLDKVVEMYRKIVDSQKYPDTQVLIRLGELYYELQKYKKAEAVYHRLNQKEPNDGFGYYGIGIIKETLGDTASAIENYIKAVRLSPELKQAWDGLGQLYMFQKKWTKAIEVFSEAIVRDSTDLYSWLQLGETYNQKEDTLSAQRIYNDIKRQFPDDWQPYSKLGHIYLDQQRFEQAHKEFQKVIELSPENVVGWLFSGISCFYQDSLEYALSYLSKAIEFEPDDPLVNYYMGLILNDLGYIKEAIPYLETSLITRPEWMSVLSTLAGIYDSLKEYTISDSLFQRALAIDSSNALILNNYGYSLSERGIHLEEAMKMALKAIEKDPENGAYLDTMGWIYFKLGNFQKALEFIERAVLIHHDNSVVIDHLGDVYKELGLTKEARQAWEKALQLDQDNIKIQKKLNNSIKSNE
jgi:tetratricopeptide (TPR) repeat protein